MPPRYAYWTILIDQRPTAFRAQHKEDLLPTFHQLQRKNPDVVMKWFARGRLWDSQQAEREAFRNRTDRPPTERRTRDWRPGGEHKDPRARFDKEKRRRDKREQRAQRNEADAARKFRPPQPPGDRPWSKETSNKPGASGDRRPPSGDRKPWSRKPEWKKPGPPRGDRPVPQGFIPRKPWSKPAPAAPKSDAPPASDPATGKPKPPER